jgi:uncharacterized protein
MLINIKILSSRIIVIYQFATMSDDGVWHNEHESRFETTINGKTAVLEYEKQGNVISFTHTGVPKQLEGRGIGTKLCAAGVAYANAHKLKINAVCWFVARYLAKLPK